MSNFCLSITMFWTMSAETDFTPAIFLIARSMRRSASVGGSWGGSPGLPAVAAGAAPVAGAGAAPVVGGGGGATEVGGCAAEGWGACAGA